MVKTLKIDPQACVEDRRRAALGLRFPKLQVDGIHSLLRFRSGSPEANPEMRVYVQVIYVGRGPREVCRGDPEAKRARSSGLALAIRKHPWPRFPEETKAISTSCNDLSMPWSQMKLMCDSSEAGSLPSPQF